MESAKVRKMVCALLLFLVTTLIGIAIARFQPNTDGPTLDSMTPQQKMDALERMAPDSPRMQRLIQTERNNVDAARETDSVSR